MRLFQQSKIGRENVGLFAHSFQREDFSGLTTYKADFWGLYIDGLVNSLPEIRLIHKRAYEFSEDSYFEDANLHRILQSDLYNCDQQLYQRLEARISSAVWINSLASHSC